MLVAFAVALPHSMAQDAATRPATRPSTDTAPASRPAEVRARHPRIGVRVDSVALEQQKIARVEQVTPGSPADRGGVKVGDIILKVAGEDIRDDKTYREVMSKRKVGESVELLVRRGGEEMDLTVTIPDRIARTEPDAVTVQHVLIMVDKPNAQGKKRNLEEARKLADEIILKARNGADFSELVKAYSEDSGSVRSDPPGSYVLANDGKPLPTPAARERGGMVAGFSALAFALDVGDVAVVPFDSDLSPYGFHIIKRVK